MLKLIVLLLVYLSEDCECLDPCRCGYGGLCVSDEEGKSLPVKCHCDEVSKGFYEDDCVMILDHCNSSPCSIGTCRANFGGYFCECPQGRIGKHCEIPATSDDDFFVTNSEVYVYYQIQPSTPVGPHLFTLVHNITEPLKYLHKQVQITFSDGRLYYLTKSQFKLTDVKGKCVSDAQQNMARLDIGVCNYLPEGDVYAYTLDVFFSSAKSVPLHDLIIDDAFGVIGRKASIVVEILLKTPDHYTVKKLYRQEYRIFSYFHKSAKYCLIDSQFLGCSTNADMPSRYNRRDRILVRGWPNVTNCDGVLLTGNKWFLQRHVNPQDHSVEKDFMPRVIAENQGHFRFPRFYLSRGFHMIEFMYEFRGTPPYHGGTNTFVDYSRCWIVITSGDPFLVTDGGSWRTVSCHSRLALPISTGNRNFKLSDLSITAHCNVSSDVDCKPRSLSVAVLTKSTIPPCDSYYEYTFDVRFSVYEKLLASVRKYYKYKIVIHFIPTLVDLRILCLVHCYPVSTTFKLLMYAASRPYFPQHVNWTVTLDGKEVDLNERQIIGEYLPQRSSRIFSMWGDVLVDVTKKTADIFLTVSHGPNIASTNLIGNNLLCDHTPENYDIIFSDSTKRYISIVPKTALNLTYPVGTYDIYEYNKLANDSIQIITTQYIEHLQKIALHWPSVEICLYDGRSTEQCFTKDVEGGNFALNHDINMTDIEEAYYYKNVRKFISVSILYMFDLLSQTNENYFTWPGKIEERIRIAYLANTLDVKDVGDGKTTFFLLSIFFYSEIGNKNEKIHPYIEEDVSDDNLNLLKRVSLRYIVLKFFERVLKNLDDPKKEFLLPFQGQDIRDLVLRTWSLAHAQGTTQLLLDQLTYSHTVDFAFLFGELKFLHLRNTELIAEILQPLTSYITQRSRLYYGLTCLGLQHTRAWSLSTTYVGILFYLERNKNRTEKRATRCNWILGNPVYLGPENLLLNQTMISLPPPPDQWREKQFSLCVLLVENRKGDKSYSPALLIRLSDKNNIPITNFPGEYNVTLPYMVNGTISRADILWEDVSQEIIVRHGGGRRLRSFNTYKVTLPDSFQYWDLLIGNYPGTSLKVKVFFDTVPDFDETFASPVIPSIELPGYLVRFTIVTIKPQGNNKTLPRHFYVGILPGDESSMRENWNITIVKSFYVCKVWLNDGSQANCKGHGGGVLITSLTKCQCDQFGMIIVNKLLAGFTRIMAEEISLVYPVLYNVIYRTLVIVVFSIMTCIVIGYVLWKDFKRKKEVTLLNAEDNYIEDWYTIIIGIYTGMKCYGAATSTVAIQLEGSHSSSRVHVLQVKTQKTMRAGHDDWFKILTNKPLGTINTVCIWLNYGRGCDWYCKKIMIFDIAISRWYVLPVNCWIGLHSPTQETRLSTFNISEAESMIPEESQTFVQHFAREIRNTHIVASLFILHPRCIKSYEQGGFILIVDVLAMFMGIWLIEEVAYQWIYDEYYDGGDSKMLIGVTQRTFTTALLGAVFSSIFTVAIRTAYSSIYISRFYQKRTTNPVYMDVTIAQIPRSSTAKSLSFSRISRFSRFSRFSLTRSFFSRTESSQKSGTEGSKFDIPPWSTKATFRQRWKIFLTLFFGPAQFRCVNVESHIFRARMFWSFFFLRSLAAFMILGLLASLVCVELWFEYWRKLSSTLFLTGIAFLIDVFILNPLFILVSSFLTIYILKVSNSEISFINEELRIKNPPVVSHTAYQDTATKKQYKPLLTTEIDDLRRKGSKFQTALLAMYYAILTISIVCCVILLWIRMRNVYYLESSTRMAFSRPSSIFNRTVPVLDKVHSKRMVTNFIITALASMDTIWYNGKPISKEGGRWGKDGFSKSVGSTLVIVYFLDSPAREYTAKEFIGLYRHGPCGYLSENTQTTKDVNVHGVPLSYSVINSWNILGKSGEVYPLAGHTQVLHLRPWSEYYTSLRLLLHDLVAEKGPCSTRAILFFSNYYNPFVNRWITAKLLIEFLPSGLLAAILHVDSTFVERGSIFSLDFYNVFEMTLGSTLIVYIPLLTTILASAIGVNVIKRHLMKLILLVAYGCFLVVSVFYVRKWSIVEELIYDPYDKQHDLSLLYIYDEMYEMSLLAIVGTVMLEFALLVLSVIGSQRLKSTAIECIHRSCAVLVIFLLFNTEIRAIRRQVSPGGTDFYDMLQVSNLQFQAETVMLKVLVLLMIYSLRYCDSLDPCHCGYGGVCIADSEGRSFPVNCLLCKQISGGFYENDCNTVHNHCKSSPCVRGTCQSTFGGYFCECPQGRIGKRCEMTVKSGDNFNVPNNEVYVYYQVQPASPLGTHPFTIIYNVTEQPKYVRLLVQISISDGRIYFLTKSEFKLKDVKEDCISDALQNEARLDSRVCDYLPEGDVYQFTFDAFFGFDKHVRDYDLVEDPIHGLIGRKGVVEVEIFLKSRNHTTLKKLYKSRYKIFSYFYVTAKRCLIDSQVTGCSTNVNKPFLYARRDHILLRDVSRVSNCDGVFYTGNKWFLQRHINPNDHSTDKDFVPIFIGENQKHFLIPAHYLDRGIHMIEFLHEFRGTPPYHGGTNTFSDYSRCWIVITSGEPLLLTQGGSVLTMSCHNVLALPISTANQNLKVSELTIMVSCNVTSDRDCIQRPLSLSMLTKSKLPECDSYYEYVFDVRFTTYESRSASVEHSYTYKTVIHFIPTQIELRIECLFNCHPINPKFKVLMYAESRPYFPNPVNWSVTRDGTEIESYDPVGEYSPMTASRILRLWRADFVDEGKRTTGYTFKVSYGPNIAAVSMLGVNVKYDNKPENYKIVFTDSSNRAITILPEHIGPLTYPKRAYDIHEYNSLAKDSVPLVRTQYNENLRGIVLHWPIIIICLYDNRATENCFTHEVKGGNFKQNQIENITDIEEAYQYRNIRLFLINSVRYLINLLTQKSADYFTWPGKIDDRITIVDLANTLRMKNPNDGKAALFMMSILFYSEVGNWNEELHPYIEENVFDGSKPTSLLKRVSLRHSVLRLFSRIMQSIQEDDLEVRVDRLRVDLRKDLIRVWALAHAQGTTQLLINELRYKHNRNNAFLFGELAFLHSRSSEMTAELLEPIASFIAYRSRLYYGIRCLGANHARAWSVRSTYMGLLYHLRKDKVKTETLGDHCDWIFGYPHDHHEDVLGGLLNNTWISLPSPPDQWRENEFTFFVLLVKNRKGDKTVSPNLYIRLANKENELIENFPGVYNVSLPSMVNGSLNPPSLLFDDILSELIYKTDKVPRPLRLFNTYKITLPGSFQEWDMHIGLPLGSFLKAHIFDTVPDLNVTINSPMLPYEDLGLPVIISTLKIKAEKGKTIPKHFYVGILPFNESQMTQDWLIIIIRSLYLCRVKLSNGKTVVCKGLPDQKVVIRFGKINCNCDHFGLLNVGKLLAGFTRIWTDEITLVYPVLYNVVFRGVAIIIFTVMICAVMSYVLLKDYKRKEEVTLLNAEDNYVEDWYLMIIGVYTGMRCNAGVKGSVSIQLEGSNSSSRVHVLRSKAQDTLQAGNDDWFKILTKKPLGIIKSVRIWLNYGKRCDWYCKKILMFDVAMSRWYVLPVNSWIGLNSPTNESRLSTFKINEDELITGEESPTFKQHYKRELRNSHTVASMFLLHPRSIKTFEQLGYILIVDVLAIFMGVWVIEEVAYEMFYDEYLDGGRSKILIGVTSRTFTTAALAALWSGIFSFGIRTAYRSIYISRFYQKRTTNPVYMDVTISQTPRSSAGKSFSLPRFQRISVSHSLFSRTESPLKSGTYDYKNELLPWSTKAAFRQRWKVFMTLFFGPVQFRCVNVENHIFRARMFWHFLILRSIAILMILGLLFFVVFIELFTEYWRKLKVSLFLTGVAFSIDIFILNPLFILFSSFVSFYMLKISNSELFFINEELKIKNSPVISYTKYAETATGKQYKPMLTKEIEDSKRKISQFQRLLYIIYYAILIISLIGCVILLRIRLVDVFNLEDSIKLAFSHPSSLFNKSIPDIGNIHSKKKASDFVITALSSIDAIWYNDKPISKDGSRWGKDSFSKSGGSTLAILYFMDTPAGEYTAKEFIGQYRHGPCGFLSDNTQTTDEVEVHSVLLRYSSTSFRRIEGRSGEVYPRAGHIEFLSTRHWSQYYTSLRLLLHDLVSKKSTCTTRAVLFITNYFNPFINTWITVELFIEFLPSGLSTAVIYVRML
ncbi:hypothetical protein GE061_017675 [Apolygus lucorum]|uniref:EGF-like domain-containing protein n=1 Tax=Apolygus lucorum TaxID=248454 RepID=A0A8S9XBP3_APOLU|nr:hypothetical protein GE061_017675 [Apolygus lucorum]